MRYKYLLILMLTAGMFSCKKEKGTIDFPTPLPTQHPPMVLLKDIVIPNLPSPYYHFEYDSAGKVSFVSFASDLTRYNVLYSGNKISEMRNNILVNKDRLQYFYDNEGKVVAVKYADSTGEVYKRIIFSYDGQKLIESERQQKEGTGFIIEKTMTFSYYPDGNLKELAYHYLPLVTQTEATYTDRFEQYDNNINADGFGLLHNEFFDHLILLPGVELQKNNPAKETRIGDGVNYSVDYRYSYNDKNAPLTKIGDLIITNGTDSGRHFQTHSVYSYY